MSAPRDARPACPELFPADSRVKFVFAVPRRYRQAEVSRTSVEGLHLHFAATSSVARARALLLPCGRKGDSVSAATPEESPRWRGMVLSGPYHRDQAWVYLLPGSTTASSCFIQQVWYQKQDELRHPSCAGRTPAAAACPGFFPLSSVAECR